MKMTKFQLFQKLKAAVSAEEWESLKNNGELTISQFNRNILLEWENEAVLQDTQIREEAVSGLYTALKKFLEKNMEDRPDGWKWIIISCIYLTFIAERPMHPIEMMDIRETAEDGKTVYECPAKSRDEDTVCSYCVCRRMSNYEIMKRKMQKEFLKYDQEKMIQKYNLACDREYIYIEFLGHRYRISRESGKVLWSDDDFCTFHEAGYNEAMTIYDVLCYAEDDCTLAGEFVNMDSLSSVQVKTGTLGKGLFQEAEQFFDHKEEALHRACRNLKGVESGKGDISYCIPMFEFFPVVISFWNSDDEFPASLQIFTDKNALEYMHYETLWFAVFHLIERIRQYCLFF